MKGKYVRGMTLEEDISERMKNPGFRRAWKALDAEFELLESMIQARERAGISQEELARRIGTKQPALSRLEREGGCEGPVETLKKIADALDMRLVVKLQRKQHRA
jgi:ribosome-binding protein aMBF1 (putative translation factor)